MSIDVFQLRPDINRIIRQSDLTTITSRKVRRQLEAEKRLSFRDVKKALDRLINECFEDIYLPSILLPPPPPAVPRPCTHGLRPIFPRPSSHAQSVSIRPWPRDPTFQFGVDRRHFNPMVPIPRFDIDAMATMLSASQPSLRCKPEMPDPVMKEEVKKKDTPHYKKKARDRWQVRVSPGLAELIRVEQGTWLHVGKLLWDYIKAHGKPVPGKASYFGDAKLEALIGPRTYTRGSVGIVLPHLVARVEE